MKSSSCVLVAFVVVVAAGSTAWAQSGPPGRVGRLAFVDGTVSFHDDQAINWSPAVANTPLTSGDAVWTEPGARSEISISGTRVRLDGGTELDLLDVDDSQTRMQLAQGRVDIKTFTYDTRQPYQIVTPRGVITLQQQGDYYVEAGTTEDPTRLGVRQGAAQIQSSNGQVLAVRAGEIGEISGDYGMPQLRTMRTAPPPMPAYWAQRDRQIIYDQPPQYLSYGVTGYEDLNAYGEWSNDPEYGQVWYPRAVSADWAPYRTGHWAYVRPWGWTWVDDQPWGFAPYHYGRWAHRGNRWMWVAPQRDVRPVYAPALVAFIGGIELSITLGDQRSAPVGWFPLGPREAYVPPYSINRDYYRRINTSARVQDQVMEERWEHAQRHEAIAADRQRDDQMVNRRFVTVVPASAFTRSEPVARVALRVDPQKIAAAPVAPVAAPPAPTASIRANVQAPNQPAQQQRQPQASVPTAQTSLANMQAIGRPTVAEAPRREAPGPKIASRPPAGSAAPNKPALPQLAPRSATAPSTAPAAPATQPPATQQPRAPAQANPPPVRAPQATTMPAQPQAPHPPRAEPPQATPPQATPAIPATPAQPQQQQKAVPATPATPAQPPHQAVTPPAAQPQHTAPAAPPPRPQVQPQRPAPSPAPSPQTHAPATPAPPPQAAPSQVHTPAPPPAAHPAPSPQHSAPQKKDEEKK